MRDGVKTRRWLSLLALAILPVLVGTLPGVAQAAPTDPQVAAVEFVEEDGPNGPGGACNGVKVGPDEHPDREQVIRRARSWLGGTQANGQNYYGTNVPYTQGDCYTNQYGTYRQDCSGLVSMAWGLGTEGDDWWTYNLQPEHSAGRTISISQSDLQPGDALLRHTGDPNENHVAIFVQWISGTGGSAEVIEQTGGSIDHGVERTWSAGTVDLYRAIRYAKLGATIISAGGYGDLNRVRPNGTLQWWHHYGYFDGTWDWATPYDAGNGFNMFEKVVGTGSSILGIKPNGNMYWYAYTPGTGWLPGTGNQIGSGWGQFKFVMNAGGGTFYAITYSGDLRWYGYTGSNGSWSWDPDSGKVIGTGWAGFIEVTANAGTIYAVRSDGSLRWYYYSTPGSGSAASATGGNVIGTGWVGGTCDYRRVMAGDNGRIYAAMDDDNVLKWWHHLDPTGGSADWQSVASCGNTVGTGWL